MKILMGADPELFITDDKGRFRSAHGMIPGTKEEPYKVAKGAVQVDGMALEFNIDPAECEDEFVDNISTVLAELRKMVPSKYNFAFVPSANFHGNHMRVQPEEAKELGCQPDFDPYTMKDNPRPNGNTNLRTASGHVHIGFTDGANTQDEEHILRCATLAKHLDVFLGIRSLEWDNDQKRRTLYGRAGALRVKPYGVEYRVLSNAWLREEKTVRFVYRQTLAGINNLRNGGKVEDHDYQTVKSIIEGRMNVGNLRYFGGEKLRSLYNVAKKTEL